MTGKMRVTIARMLFQATAFLFAAIPAAACSLDPDYVGPSNFEMVQIADAIVIATAQREIKGEDDDRAVNFIIGSALKGEPPSNVTLTDSRLGNPEPSDLDDLSEVHPESGDGACNRYTFRKGERYLLFLTRSPDGVWRDVGFPYARINEDYVGERDEWIRAVRRYLKLQRMFGPVDQLTRLREMAKTGRDLGGASLSTTALNDIKAHLAHPSPWKPTTYLLEALRQVEQKGVAGTGLQSPHMKEVGLAHMLSEFVTGPAPRAGTSDAEEMRLFLLKALVEGDHPDASTLFEGILESAAPNYSEFGLALRFFAKNGQYGRAYQWIETKLLPTLPALSRKAESELLSDIGQVQSGDWSAMTPRWRSDPHAAATWPELALKIYAHQVEKYGAGSARFTDAIAAIPVADFRERPLATLARASRHDRNVRTWATAELRGLLRGVTPASSSAVEAVPGDPAALPLQALLIGWSSENYPILTDMFCAGASRRSLLISSLGTHATTNYEDLLARIAVTPPITSSDRQLLAKAIGDMAERLALEDDGFFSVSRRLKRMLEQVEKGEKIEAKPIVCG